LLLSQPVLGLGDLEPPLSVQGDETDPQVGTTEVDGEVFTGLFTAGVAEDEGRDCGEGESVDRNIVSPAARTCETGRQRLTHRYDLSVLLKTLVQSLLEGVYDHPHPLGRDYVQKADEQVEIRENRRAGNQLESANMIR
jgi:hypothetical protein